MIPRRRRPAILKKGSSTGSTKTSQGKGIASASDEFRARLAREVKLLSISPPMRVFAREGLLERSMLYGARNEHEYEKVARTLAPDELEEALFTYGALIRWTLTDKDLVPGMGDYVRAAVFDEAARRGLLEIAPTQSLLHRKAMAEPGSVIHLRPLCPSGEKGDPWERVLLFPELLVPADESLLTLLTVGLQGQSIYLTEAQRKLIKGKFHFLMDEAKRRSLYYRSYRYLRHVRFYMEATATPEQRALYLERQDKAKTHPFVFVQWALGMYPHLRRRALEIKEQQRKELEVRKASSQDGTIREG